MSDGNNETLDASCYCASCGVAELDDIKLVPCDGCDLVKYCGDDCRENHQSEHEEDCKKRAAELRDELLFKQPESSHLGDCPICSLPLPLDQKKYGIYQCCSKMICKGCASANWRREDEMRVQRTCPFCRVALPKSDEEFDKQRTKRIEVNDPVAISHQGMKQYDSGDYSGAFEYFTKAAELGNAEAHRRLSGLYHDGNGVEEDERKFIYHAEEASIGGHPKARCALGLTELGNGNDDRAVKHFVISATQGDDLSIKMLLDLYRDGEVEKEVLAAALRAHKAAVDATKSPQREEAEE